MASKSVPKTKKHPSSQKSRSSAHQKSKPHSQQLASHSKKAAQKARDHKLRDVLNGNEEQGQFRKALMGAEESNVKKSEVAIPKELEGKGDGLAHVLSRLGMMV